MGALFSQLFQYLKDFGSWLLESLVSWLVDLINLLIEALAGLCAMAMALLPSPTFDWSPPSWLVTHAGEVSWFFPLGTLATCLGICAVAGVAYFPWKMIMKFAHLQ